MTASGQLKQSCRAPECFSGAVGRGAAEGNGRVDVTDAFDVKFMLKSDAVKVMLSFE
jgi:hypothetical protein